MIWGVDPVKIAWLASRRRQLGSKAVPPAPAASSSATRAVMRGNRGKETAPELALRSELHRRGLRYRIHERPLADRRCEADIVFRKAWVAVFVDGCWWHGCPDHRPLPKRNHSWWARKIQATVERDRRNDDALARAGWTVVRIWEHDDPAAAADRIERILSERAVIAPHHPEPPSLH